MFATFKTFPEMLKAFPTEQSAIDHLVAIRWADGAYCPHCQTGQTDNVSRMNKLGVPTNQYKCYACRQKFTVKVGTIFQDTKLELRMWFAAIWLITAHPKGIASTTLAADLGVTQKTAWFMLHRLRHAARTDSFNAPLSGEVMVDEAYIGGKESNKHANKRTKGTAGGKGKTIVMGLVQKDGEVRAGVIESTERENLEGVIGAHVVRGSTVVTDEFAGYKRLARQGYDHRTVSHGRGQYVKDGFSTNAVESLWALFKRQYHGTHHWISPKHMDAYLGEMAFRLNRRDVTKGDRVNALLSQVQGPLPYKVLIA